jgi:hypothetical protein
MLDVVRVDVALVGAAREPAAAVAGVERAANRRRNAARLAPDIERFALLGFAVFISSIVGEAGLQSKLSNAHFIVILHGVAALPRGTWAAPR